MILSSEFSHFNFLCFLSAINFSLFFQKLLDIMEDKGIEVIEAHSITEEAFENLGEESNVSHKSALNKSLEKRTTSIDQTEKNPSNDCEKTEIFYCNSCGVDDWFDCLCSDSENESQSDKKAIEISPDSEDLGDETKSDKKVIEVKEFLQF